MRDEYVQMIFCVCVSCILENSVNCHGKVMEFYYQISVNVVHVSLAASSGAPG